MPTGTTNIIGTNKATSVVTRVGSGMRLVVVDPKAVAHSGRLQIPVGVTEGVTQVSGGGAGAGGAVIVDPTARAGSGKLFITFGGNGATTGAGNLTTVTGGGSAAMPSAGSSRVMVNPNMVRTGSQVQITTGTGTGTARNTAMTQTAATPTVWGGGAIPTTATNATAINNQISAIGSAPILPNGSGTIATVPTVPVNASDNLFSIAANNGSSPDAILAANPGLTTYYPPAGSTINVPVSVSPIPYSGKVQVWAGRDLQSYAAQFGLTLEQIRSYNPGVSDTPQPGVMLSLVPPPQTVGATGGGTTGGVIPTPVPEPVAPPPNPVPVEQPASPPPVTVPPAPASSEPVVGGAAASPTVSTTTRTTTTAAASPTVSSTTTTNTRITSNPRIPSVV